MNATCGTSIMYHPQDKEGNNVLYVFVCIIIVKILWQRVSNSNLISVFSHKKVDIVISKEEAVKAVLSLLK